MKRIWILALAVCGAVLFTACGKPAGNTESSSESTTASSEASTDSTETASQEAPGNGAEFKILTGSVVDQAMSTFTIKTESEEELSFIKGSGEGLDSGVLGTATDGGNGSGAMVKVTYVTVNYDAGSKTNFPLKVEAAK